MGLRYATVTGVARDDLPDGGAWLYAQTCAEIHAAVPGCGVELLIPDFNADAGAAGRGVRGARPRCSRTTSRPCRGSSAGSGPGFRYERSLDVLRQARAAGLVTKSNLILGLGEERARSARPWPTCARRAANCHHHPVPAALGAAPPGRPVGAARGVRRARARRPSGSASPA